MKDTLSMYASLPSVSFCVHLGLRSQPSYDLTSPERRALRGHEHQEYSSCHDREGECAQRSKDRPTVGKVKPAALLTVHPNAQLHVMTKTHQRALGLAFRKTNH